MLARIVDGRADDQRRNAATFEFDRHLGMEYLHHAADDSVVGARDAPVERDLEPVLGLVVANFAGQRWP